MVLDFVNKRQKIETNYLPEPDESAIGYQVASGTFNVSPLPQHALVIAQGWPSWTFALEGLGFESISTIASFSNLSSREEFRSTSMGQTLISREAVSKWALSHDSDGVVFVQGNSDFLDLTHQKLKGFQDLICIFGCSDPNFNTEDSWREIHADAGGVTNGGWSFFSPNVNLPTIETFGVRR